MKKVLVTGGLGFIGSHLVELLLPECNKIFILDNCINSAVPEDYFKGHKSVSVLVGSIKDVDLQKEFGSVDRVFHLASILGPSGVLKYAGNLGLSVLSDTIKIRDYCINCGAKLVDISTSEVYGHPGVLAEDSNKVFPGTYQVRTEYGSGKMLSEMSVVNRASVFGDISYNFIRPFNVTGPRQRPDGGFVLPRFVIGALTGQPLTVYGDGTQMRAFTHVMDICEAIVSIVHSGIENEIWNIGNPHNEMSIRDMAHLVVYVIQRMGLYKNSEVIFVDPKTIHGPHFAEAVDKIPYIKKIETSLGWYPKRSAEQIIEDVVNYYRIKIENGYYFEVM